MESLFYNISQVLGITLIHSLWQGLLVWFVLRVILSLAPGLTSVKKHDLAMFSLVTISALFIYTFITQLRAHTWVYFIGGDNTAFVPQLLRPFLHHNVANATISNYYSYAIEGFLPYISAFYFAGLVFNLLKMGLNWQRISLIKRTMIPADGLQEYADGLCKKLGISKTVWVNFSRMVDVPCMIGFFSPIVLLPITLTTYLSAKEIEAILLHELSHIKRNDYLLNLVQQFIGILLFFNPFAQLINRIINQERENHCDDMVVQTTAQPMVYAQALLKLEQTRQTNFQLALAATGKKYHLLSRIERIMKTNKPMGNVRHLLVGVAIMAASISSIAWLNPTIKNGKLSIKKVAYPVVIQNLLADTTPKKAVTAKKPVVRRSVAAKPTSKLKVKTHIDVDMGPQFAGMNDEEMNRLTAEISKHANAIGKYYDSPEFHQQQKLMDEKAQAMQAYYNRPELKKLQAEQQELAEEFQKNWAQTDETTKISTQMGDLGKSVGAYYNSAEFKEMNEKLEKKYGIPHDHNYNNDSKDENYRKYQAELDSKVSPEIKEQTKQMKELGEKMRSHYDSPEFRKKRDELRAMGDSMRQAYGSRDMKIQQEDMKRLGEQMRKYQDNPEMKKEQAKLQEATKKLKEYMKSDAFKKRMEDYKKQMDVMLKDKDNSKDYNPIPVQGIPADDAN